MSKDTCENAVRAIVEVGAVPAEALKVFALSAQAVATAMLADAVREGLSEAAQTIADSIKDLAVL